MFEHHNEECELEYRYTSTTNGTRAFWCHTHKQWAYNHPTATVFIHMPHFSDKFLPEDAKLDFKRLGIYARYINVVTDSTRVQTDLVRLLDVGSAPDEPVSTRLESGTRVRTASNRTYTVVHDFDGPCTYSHCKTNKCVELLDEFNHRMNLDRSKLTVIDDG